MSLDQLLNRGYKKNPIPNRVLELLAQSANYSKNLIIIDFSIINGRLHYRRLLYISNYYALQLHVCKQHYNTLVADHLGISNTYKFLYCSYYWLNMQRFVHKYVHH